jgi:single-strand DNA-binding protein
MSSRSLNKVQLIGNLTRDPELRYTPQGTAVCTFGLATNRSWTTEGGEKREETEFHRVVAWNKLAELCSQLLFKGRKVYVEGRLQTRTWTAQDGSQRQATEVVIEEMIILDSRQAEGEPVGGAPAAPAEPVTETPPPAAEEAPAVVPAPKKGKAKAEKAETDLQDVDIPF